MAVQKLGCRSIGSVDNKSERTKDKASVNTSSLSMEREPATGPHPYQMLKVLSTTRTLVEVEFVIEGDRPPLVSLDAPKSFTSSSNLHVVTQKGRPAAAAVAASAATASVAAD